MRLWARGYVLLLRLYPARYREAFGGEMRMTFDHLIAERQGTAGAICFLREIRDIPLGALREHLAERREKERMMMSAKAEFQNGVSFTVFRASMVVIGTLVVLTVLFSILPFYAFGLHAQPANLVTGGHFDPKGMVFYQSLLGMLVYVMGIMLFIATPVFLIAFVPLMLVGMARSWRALTWQWQAAGVGLLMGAAALAAFLYAGTGRLILTWFMD